MIKALDTIETKRMSLKTTGMQKTMAEKVKSQLSINLLKKCRLLIVFGYLYLQERRSRMTGIAASMNKLCGKAIERV